MTAPNLVDAFFTSPNQVDPSRLEGTLRELLGGLSARLDTARIRTLLPARVDGKTRWYGIAPSDREARLLREELRSWLGPPISERIVEVRGLDDQVDQAALALVPGGTVLRVDVDEDWKTEARSNVASLTDVWVLAPPRGVDQPRPLGRVLRQFYEAVLAADRSSAESALDEIKARALLNATNLRFLRVELLASLGSPEDLRDDSLLRGISLLARPSAVTAHLAAAAESLFIASASGVPEDTDWVTVAERLDEAWPSLVIQSGQVTTRATARCFALQELLRNEPRTDVLAEVARRFPNDEVLRAITSSATPIPFRESLDTPLGLYHAGNYSAALEAAESQNRGRSATSVALAAAVNLGDSASAVRALALVDAMTPAERDVVLGSAVERAFYDQLLARTSEARVPEDWLDWLRGEWADRPDLLMEWAGQWRRDIALDSSGEELAVELLDALHDGRRGRVRNGLPVFIDWLVDEGLPSSGVGLATTIFDILLSSEPGRIERQVSLNLLEEVLLVGCTSQEYAELINAVTEQLQFLGARDAPWLAECLDLFMECSSPDLSRRHAVIAEAAGVATAWLDRLEPDDVSILRQVFADADMPFAVGTSQDGLPPSPPFCDLKQVGIYSLLEGASQVAADRIRSMFPNVQVRTSSEHVNSQTLVALVRGVDVMLVQTSHAKHAATQAIAAASLDPRRVVFVHGRGATALVRELLAWVHGSTVPPFPPA
ncbi:MAG: protein DpdD [Actinomycetota bacterium]|nr:protein DpdD [Actinomycetota bacterium]